MDQGRVILRFESSGNSYCVCLRALPIYRINKNDIQLIKINRYTYWSSCQRICLFKKGGKWNLILNGKFMNSVYQSRRRVILQAKKLIKDEYYPDIYKQNYSMLSEGDQIKWLFSKSNRDV